MTDVLFQIELQHQFKQEFYAGSEHNLVYMEFSKGGGIMWPEEKLSSPILLADVTAVKKAILYDWNDIMFSHRCINLVKTKTKLYWGVGGTMGGYVLCKPLRNLFDLDIGSTKGPLTVMWYAAMAAKWTLGRRGNPSKSESSQIPLITCK